MMPHFKALKPSGVNLLRVAKSAALGAALSAAHGWFSDRGEKVGWDAMVAGFTAPIPASEIQPSRKAAARYDQLIDCYSAWENRIRKDSI